MEVLRVMVLTLKMINDNHNVIDDNENCYVIDHDDEHFVKYS